MIRTCVLADFLSEDNKDCIMDAAEKYGYSVEFFESEEAAEACAQEAEVIYSMSRTLIERAPKVKWCQSPFAGVDKLLASGKFDSGDVVLTNSAGAYGLAISEYIIMAALMLMRQMPAYRIITGCREWKQNLPARSIYSSKVAIIGTGDIGKNAAKRFKVMGAASVIGFNRSGRRVPEFDEIYKVTDFREHVNDVDLLVMCVPGTRSTRGLLDREKIEYLPDKAFVINVGRGSAIDQDELMQALTEGRIAGAALDVVDPEPLPQDHPLWDAPNLIITPHISGDMSLPHTVDLSVDIFCENMKRYACGEEMIKVINPEIGY